MRNKNSIKKIVGSHEFFMLCVMAILAIVFQIKTNGLFLSGSNLINIVVSYSYLGIMAMGLLVVVISGGIDISFMTVATISQYIMAKYILSSVDSSPIVAIAIALTVGIGLGLINAVLVRYLKAPTMIITIATMEIHFGLLMFLTKGVRLIAFPEWFSVKTPAKLELITIGTLALAAILTSIILRFTKIGRRIYAVGGNSEAAQRMGINLLKTNLFIYGYIGAMAALGGFVHLYLVQQAAPNALYGGEMDVVAMVVIGGVALSGGKGNVAGTIIGVLLISMMSNGLLLCKVSSYWQNVCVGLIILVSFCVSGYRVIKAKLKESKGGQLDE